MGYTRTHTRTHCVHRIQDVHSMPHASPLAAYLVEGDERLEDEVVTVRQRALVGLEVQLFEAGVLGHPGRAANLAAVECAELLDEALGVHETQHVLPGGEPLRIGPARGRGAEESRLAHVVDPHGAGRRRHPAFLLHRVRWLRVGFCVG